VSPIQIGQKNKQDTASKVFRQSPCICNTKINKYLELSVAMRNLWCLEKKSILPLIISATEIVSQNLFKNLGLREPISDDL
jgi:hypothetical protein